MLALGLSAFCGYAGTPQEIPFQYRDGYLWLKVSVEGYEQPLNFLLDSGAASSVLNLGTARRLGVKFGGRVPVQGVHSLTDAYRIDNFEANVEGVALPKKLLALDLSAVSKTCHQPIDGLIGVEFFHRRIVQLDFSAEKIRFLARAPLGDDSVRLPLKARNGTFCVPVGIAGNDLQWMRVDTGCDSSLEWVGGKAEKIPRFGASIGLANASVRSLRMDVRLGECHLPGVPTGLHSREIFPGESGLLGNGVLSQFRVTLDTVGRQFIVDRK
ncbi:MAG: aspartyl protease family protein [Terrimicrobiaceae bacterium]|nr:aspartyl protease family protein [Terrimicrobiaceae bacterium]